MLQLVLIFSFFSSYFIIHQIFRFYIGKKNAIIRLKKYTNVEEIREEKKKSFKKDYKSGFNILSKRIGSARALDGYKKKIQFNLTRAHILLKAEEFITVCIILFIVLALIIFIISGSFLYSLLAGLLGWLFPSILLKAKAKRRIKHLNDQLGDSIVMISNSLKAGYSFFQSVDVVAKEMTGPISEEFTLLQKELNLGVSTEKALENIVARVLSDDLELVITAVLIQRQVGGNLSEVLDNISSTIRERLKIKGEIRTVTAQGKMSGMIISLMPVGLGVILFFINPDHIMLLFRETLGIGILAFSVFMELIGIYFISKIIKIEV